MFLRSLATALTTLFFSLPSFAQDQAWTKDITGDLVHFMNTHFVGKEASSSKTWDYTELGFGKKVKATGTAKVVEAISHTGSVRHVFFQSDGEIMSNHVKTDDLSLTYRYDGYSIGRAHEYPGGAFIGHEWGWQYPKGTIVARLYANPGRGYRVEVTYNVISDGDSRAQEVTGKAAYELRHVFAERLASYLTGVLGSAVQVDL
jgi:hypothetical protein